MQRRKNKTTNLDAVYETAMKIESLGDGYVTLFSVVINLLIENRELKEKIKRLKKS